VKHDTETTLKLFWSCFRLSSTYICHRKICKSWNCLSQLQL